MKDFIIKFYKFSHFIEFSLAHVEWSCKIPLGTWRDLQGSSLDGSNKVKMLSTGLSISHIQSTLRGRGKFIDNDREGEERIQEERDYMVGGYIFLPTDMPSSLSAINIDPWQN